MPPRGATSMSVASSSSTPYALSLLCEYAHTLDSLPIDLSRNFADLRELDAVLSSSMASINTKISRLIDMIENRTASKEERLWLLSEIADEAARLKLGGDDKIRVACQAADSLRAHSQHLTALLTHVPGFEPSIFIRNTTYPHVSPRSFPIGSAYETGRRRRAANSSGLLLGSTELSPNKRRKPIQEEDFDYGSNKSPRKEKAGEPSNPQSRPFRGGARTKKTDRAPSPSESLLSVASHIPGLAAGGVPSHPRNSAGNVARGSSASTKRRPATQNPSTNANAADGASLLDTVLSRKDHHNMAPSSSTSHPSLPQADASAFSNGNERGAGVSQSGHQKGKSATPGRDWVAPPSSQLEGPGMPAARTSTLSSLNANAAPLHGASPAPANGPSTSAGGGNDGDGEAENDDGKIYCFCDNVSYGEMIACDDDTCDREWFHLTCIGLAVPPDGQWFCDTCRGKRVSRRSSRGGKKRSGGRSGARAGGGASA